MEDACFSCLNCAGEACEYETGENPPQCVQGLVTDEMHAEVHDRYRDPENHRIMKAAIMTSERCSNLTRVQETIEFAYRLGARKIGIATWSRKAGRCASCWNGRDSRCSAWHAR